jgi:hypothetical protein
LFLAFLFLFPGFGLQLRRSLLFAMCVCVCARQSLVLRMQQGDWEPDRTLSHPDAPDKARAPRCFVYYAAAAAALLPL